MADNQQAYTFGLDIGIASVGWAVLASNRIVDLGVRAFDKAETAKEGEPLNKARREARLLRRRLWRRAWRLTKLARLLKRDGLIDSADFFKVQPPKESEKDAPNPWKLRVAALDRLLTQQEWARVLYHLCKHRGFHWVSKAEERQAEEGGTASEGGRVKKGLAHTKALMEQKNYRTAAEMVLAEFPGAQRNKQGNYDKALSRVLLDEELAKLFEAQRSFRNPNATAQFEAAIRGENGQRGGLFWEQKPMQSVLHMLGKCTFEPTEYRAPKASFTAERHVWLTRLLNLKIHVDGVIRPLTEAERQIALPLPYERASDLRYTQLRTALVNAGLPASFRFNGLSYPSDKQKNEEKAKNPEDEVLIKLPAWHELRKIFRKAELESEWQQISVAALDGRPETLDEIAWILSAYKSDEDILPRLRALDLPSGEKTVNTLLGIRFDKFHSLSLKALREIVPHMEKGLRYDEAVKETKYKHHSQRFAVGAGEHTFLPPFYEGRDKRGSMKFRDDLDVPRNPVVLRALNQARKVVNALIKTYGSPAAVHIEMARDLSRPLDERNKIKKLQDEYGQKNRDERERFEKEFGRKPSGTEFDKWMLYREQHCKCAYSLEPLDVNSVIDDLSYVQIDHALPYSRSYDDSKNNKVLVLTKENQNKGNRTAYEYLTSFAGGEDGARWRNYRAWVEGNKSYRQAKRNRLLRKNYGTEEAQGFKDRNLNDTRYICKFFKNYVEQYLRLADDSESRRCVVLNGQLTAFLRARWGLLKIREESDRHHALDAAVVAACSHAMVKRLADHARRKELEFLREGFPDPETGEIVNPTAHQRLAERFPEPWPNFRHELEARLKTDTVDELRAAATRLGTYPPEALQTLRPLFVSRAPQRRNGGAAHKETIYAKPRPDHRLMVEEKTKEGKKITRRATPEELQGMAVELIGVFETANKGKKFRLTEERLKDIVGAERNAWMIHALGLWLVQRGDDPKNLGTNVFPHKPRKGDPQDGPFTGPEIKSVKVNAGAMSGFSVRGGIVQNDTMLRLDIFSKDGKFHLVPVYVHHRVNGLPNRAIIAHKDEDEWPKVDDSYKFVFSAHPNDLLRIQQKKESFLGYYAGCDRGSGNINLWAHDRNQNIGKDGLIRGIGIKTAVKVEKLHVDTLGRVYPAPPEQRRGLA